MNKQPEITEKTKQKFVEAFWELVQEKPISKIAVSELTKRAGYNRSTFYEYFLDTNDLLSYVEKKLLEDVKQTIQQSLSENSAAECPIPYTPFPVVLAAVNDKIYWLIGPNGDPSFLPKIRKEIRPLIIHHFPMPTDIPNFDYLVCFVNSATLGLLQHWHDQDKNISSEEISTMIRNLVSRGLSSCITPEEPAVDKTKEDC